MCEEEKKNDEKILKEEFSKSYTYERPEPEDGAPTKRAHSEDSRENQENDNTDDD